MWLVHTASEVFAMGLLDMNTMNTTSIVWQKKSVYVQADMRPRCGNMPQCWSSHNAAYILNLQS